LVHTPYYPNRAGRLVSGSDISGSSLVIFGKVGADEPGEGFQGFNFVATLGADGNAVTLCNPCGE
jgi:hypothetical protein